LKEFKVKVYPSKVNLPKENQLAYRIAKVASDNSPIDNKAADMVNWSRFNKRYFDRL